MIQNEKEKGKRVKIDRLKQKIYGENVNKNGIFMTKWPLNQDLVIHLDD